MANFKEKGSRPDEEEVFKQKNAAGKTPGIDTIEFLDDDLDDDFILEQDAEAFLNEIGEIYAEEHGGKEYFEHSAWDIHRESEPELELESKLEPEWEIESEPELKSKPELESDLESDLESETMLELNSESRLESKQEPDPELKSKLKPSWEMNGNREINTNLKSPQAGAENNKKKERMEQAEKKPGKGKKIVLITAAVLVAAMLSGAGGYMALGSKYDRVFFPNTQINGINASGKSVDEVKQLISTDVDSYTLTIEGRDGKTETLNKDDIGLKAEFDSSLEKLLNAQEPAEWLKYKLNPTSYQIKTMLAYDEEAFERKLAALDLMNPSLMTEPQDARLSEYIPGKGYTIVPETEGSTIVPEAAKKAIEDAFLSLEKTLSLDEAGVYKAPAVTKDDTSLLALCSEMNRLTGMTVTYGFGDVREVLSSDRIKEWLIVGEDRIISLNQELVAGYVEELSMAYDTYNKAKTLKTSYGPTIEVRGGQYGWRINRTAETEALMEVIKAGLSVEREPVYVQSAASRTGNDYGNTYVEINLTAQHLFFYKDGSLLAESDFVSGNLSRGWTTPPGTFPLTYKQRNATLKGEGYRTPVDYWMPFNGGIGMHDAKWRSSFGGSIYKTGGSHGCINLPHSVAKKIYENISAGIPVLCYNLSGTESADPSKPPSAARPPAPAETQPQVPETQPQVPETPPQIEETPAPETAPAGPGSQIPSVEVQPTAPAAQPNSGQGTQTPPDTTAPAGPGSDMGIGSAGPGAV